MKYLKVILTVIAFLLASAVFHLIHSKALLTVLNQNYQLVINSNQAIIASTQGLEGSLSKLQKQIEELGDKLLKSTR